MNKISFSVNITINLVSLFFYLFLIVIYFRKTDNNSLKSLLFHIMCYLGIVEFILSISNIMLMGFRFNEQIILCIKKTYYLILFAILLFWIFYIFIIIFEKNNKVIAFLKKNVRFIWIILISFVVIFGIVDYIIPLKITKDIVFTGNIVPLLGIICTSLILLPLILVIFNYKKIAFRKLLPYFVTILLEVFILIMHEIFPFLSLFCLSITVLYYFIYYRLENPDIILVRRFRRYSESIRKIKEEYSFLFNMSYELRQLLNEISIEKDGYLVDGKKSINKRKLEKLILDFIKNDNVENNSTDDLLVTREIYTIDELQKILKEDNIPKW